MSKDVHRLGQSLRVRYALKRAFEESAEAARSLQTCLLRNVMPPLLAVPGDEVVTSFRAMAWATEQLVPSAGEKLVLPNYADDDGVCFPNQGRLARDTLQGTRTVRRRLAALEKMGLITRRHEKDRFGRFRAGTFALNLRRPLRPAAKRGEKPMNWRGGERWFGEHLKEGYSVNELIQAAKNYRGAMAGGKDCGAVHQCATSFGPLKQMFREYLGPRPATAPRCRQGAGGPGLQDQARDSGGREREGAEADGGERAAFGAGGGARRVTSARMEVRRRGGAAPGTNV